jgi:NADH-quinone oxidoreductase subunit G
VRPPGTARDDWEILRDLLQALGGGNAIYSIEDVFRQMSDAVPQFAGLSLSKIGDLGAHVMQLEESPPTEKPSDEGKIEEGASAQAQRRNEKST